MPTNNETICGTMGGTFLSIIPNIHSADIIKTIVLAAAGAVVSFTISLMLKWIVKKYRK